MKKRKTAILVTVVLLFICAAAVGIYFLVLLRYDGKNEETEVPHMKPWTVSDTPGLYLAVPEDYSVTSNTLGGVSDFVLYYKEDSRIKLTYAETKNDLDNYSFNMKEEYRKVTDSFSIISEFDEKLSEDTQVHVMEFDYELGGKGDTLKFSCLSAVTIGNGNAYILTCTCDDGNLQKYRDDFYDTYRSMRIITEDADEQTADQPQNRSE